VHSIAQTGLEGATLKSVADEGGWSVGVVQHYFRNKSQLLAAAADYLADSTTAILQEQAEARTALERLTEVLTQIVPADGKAQANYWKVWICFWAQATNDPLLAKTVEGHARLWRQRLATVLAAGQADGSIRPDLNADDEAAYLAAAIEGLGITAAVDSAYPYPPGMVERLVSRLASDAQVAVTNGTKKRAAKTARASRPD
jgi:AcrR family transcriptional regulator